MVPHAMKEMMLPGKLCRLSPPSSPSKRPHTSTRGPSRLLAAFDAAMLGENNKPPLTRSIQSLASMERSLGSADVLSITGEPSRQGDITQRPLQLKKVKPSTLYTKPKVAKTYPTPSLSTTLSGSTHVSRSTTASTSATVASEFPLYSYKDYTPSPAVVYIRHEDEANELVQSLSGPLGFDMEWAVTWRKGGCSERRTAVVQLCDEHMILVIQLSEMKRFPQNVKDVIESRDIIKMGANIRNDGEKLYRDYGIVAANLVELGAFAHRADATFARTYTRSIVALAKVVAHYTGKTLDKGRVRSSNWEAAPLSAEQITYAANDAHCALMVYNRLLAIAAEQGRSLGPAPYGSSITHAPNPSSTPAAGAMHRSVSYVSDVTELKRPPRPSPQHLRAYRLWHDQEMPLHEICAALRTKENPLKESTVISYVIRALQADPNLSFSMDQLKALVQSEAGSWARHRDWIVKTEARFHTH